MSSLSNSNQKGERKSLLPVSCCRTLLCSLESFRKSSSKTVSSKSSKTVPYTQGDFTRQRQCVCRALFQSFQALKFQAWALMLFCGGL